MRGTQLKGQAGKRIRGDGDAAKFQVNRRGNAHHSNGLSCGKPGDPLRVGAGTMTARSGPERTGFRSNSAFILPHNLRATTAAAKE
jgi:hypothetical protein